MKKYVGNNANKLEQQYYTSINPIAGMMAPFLKEAATYAGIINPTPKHKYQEAQYIFDCYTGYQENFAHLAKKFKLTL